MISKNKHLLLVTFSVFIFVSLSSLLITNVKPVTAAPGTEVLANSTAGDNSARHITLKTYGQIRGWVAWPLRSEGCSPNGHTYKTFPWLPANSRPPLSLGHTGNQINFSGDCSSRYWDGGGSSGGWLSPGAFGGWVNLGGGIGFGNSYVTDTDPSPTGYVGGSCQLYGGDASTLWGSPNDVTAEQAYGPGGLFQQNGYNNSPINGIGAYSNGVTLFRNTFNIDPTTYQRLIDENAEIKLYAIADDWMKVYINGQNIFASTFTKNSYSISVDVGYFNPGANIIAVQVSDKITWATNNVADSRASALCYNLTATYDGTAPTTDEQVRIRTNVVSPSGDIEPTHDANYQGWASVTNFPEITEWGYTEEAIQAFPQYQGPDNQPYGANDSFSHSYRPSASRGGCADYDYNYFTDEWECDNSWYWYCAYTGYAGTGSSPPTCPRVYFYDHNCRTYSWTDRSPSATCYDRWQCPYPNGNTYYQSSPPDCNVYRCRYAGANNYYTTSPSETDCDFRCQNGTGEPAILSYGNKYAYGDHNCYQQPEFTLTCVWDNGTSTTVVVTGNGSWCYSSITLTGSSIGQTLCGTYTARQPSGWDTNPPPGMTTSGQTTTWGFDVGQPSTGCINVIGKSYLKIYGGDVRVGGGVGAIQSECRVNNNSSIIAHNRFSDFAGAGGQYAVMGMNIINQFASAQYNFMNANPTSGDRPTELTFANQPSGSYGYGQGWGSTARCIGYVEELPNGTPVETGSVSINGTTSVPPGTSIVRHVKGNVYIRHDIRYVGSGSWTSPGQIPEFQLVVEGDIYIDNGVNQLDGLYVAIPDFATGNGGNIYTCATSMGSVPNNTFSQCKSQLVVNGALVAKKVHFLRDCGTLARSVVSEPTVYSGGTNDQVCSGANHAAEVINYTPLHWIRSSVGPPPDRYDAITSLPPIL